MVERRAFRYNVTIPMHLLAPHRVSSILKLAALGTLLCVGSSVGRSQLLVEHEAGGRDRYTSVFSPPAAYFDIYVPTRITAVTAWVNGSVDIDVTLSRVTFDDMDQPQLADQYSASFASSSVRGVPAKWQGVGGLKWDVQPGEYRVSFSDGFFPMAYGGPISTAPQAPHGYEYFYDRGWHEYQYPIGLRIYGQPLLAVPEASTFGATGALLLAGFVAFRRRRSHQAV